MARSDSTRVTARKRSRRLAGLTQDEATAHLGQLRPVARHMLMEIEKVVGECSRGDLSLDQVQKRLHYMAGILGVSLSRIEQTPLAQMLRRGGELKSRNGLVGRWQRSVRWLSSGNVIAPDWREVRSGYAAGVMPKSTG